MAGENTRKLKIVLKPHLHNVFFFYYLGYFIKKENTKNTLSKKKNNNNNQEHVDPISIPWVIENKSGKQIAGRKTKQTLATD